MPGTVGRLLGIGGLFLEADDAPLLIHLDYPELPSSLRHEILADPQRLMRSPQAMADVDILVTNHWRAEYPPAPTGPVSESEVPPGRCPPLRQ